MNSKLNRAQRNRVEAEIRWVDLALDYFRSALAAKSSSSRDELGNQPGIGEAQYRKKPMFLHLNWAIGIRTMRHDAAFLESLRDALRQAARNLQTLKLIKPDTDEEVRRVMQELRAVIPAEAEQETSSTM